MIAEPPRPDSSAPTVGRLRILWSIYRPVRRLLGLYVVMTFLGVALEGLMLASIVPLIGGRSGGVVDFFDSVLESVGLEATEQNLLLLVGVLVVLRGLTKFVTTLLQGLMVKREAVLLQVELFRSYLDVDWEVAIALTQGELQLMLTGQTRRAADLLGQLVQLLESVMFVAGLTAAALIVSPGDTLLAIALVGSTALLVTILSSRIQRHAEGALKEFKRQSTVLMQYARGSTVLRSFGVGDHAVQEIEDRAQRRETLIFRSQRSIALAVALPDILFVLALLVVVSLSFQTGSGIAQVGAVVALLYRISQYLKRFSSLAGVRERIPDLRDVHRNQVMLRSRRASPTEDSVDDTLPEGSIELEHVHFRYVGANRDAVKDVSASVAPGEFIGVVGSSGSGKSSLVHMMVGLLQPREGTLRIGSGGRRRDGLVAFVPQTPFVLKGTVRENIAWLRDFPDEAIEHAADLAGLSPVIARLPAGLDSDIAQEGLTLSGGERQRLAMARALVGSPRVLVLDEATSALDSESERAIGTSLDSLRGSVTIVAVAHRLSTVLEADRVWVMENGRIIEDAPPADLLDEPDSRFAQLGALQGVSSDLLRG